MAMVFTLLGHHGGDVLKISLESAMFRTLQNNEREKNEKYGIIYFFSKIKVGPKKLFCHNENTTKSTYWSIFFDRPQDNGQT